MADNMQLPPPGGQAGFSAVTARPGKTPGAALVTAVLLVAAGALLGLLGGAIWAALAPRVVYQVYSLNPPTAFATNPETNAFIAADGIYIFIALGGGALLGLAGYLFGVRRYGPIPMVGVVLGGLAAAFVAKWLGPLLTGQDSFNSELGASKQFALLRAPIALGAHGAIAFWPVAAAFVAGGLELASVVRERQGGGTGARVGGLPFGRHAERVLGGRRRLRGQHGEQSGAENGLPARPDGPAVRGPDPQHWLPAGQGSSASSAPAGDDAQPDPGGSVR